MARDGELARVIYGADKTRQGKLFVNGKEAKINAPIDAMNLGMGLLPDDRKAEGIIADLSVRENIILAMQAKRGMFKLLPMSRQNEIADKYIEPAVADQDGEQGDPDRAPLRRKPAEGDSGTLASPQIRNSLFWMSRPEVSMSGQRLRSRSL